MSPIDIFDFVMKMVVLHLAVVIVLVPVFVLLRARAHIRGWALKIILASGLLGIVATPFLPLPGILLALLLLPLLLCLLTVSSRLKPAAVYWIWTGLFFVFNLISLNIAGLGGPVIRLHFFSYPYLYIASMRSKQQIVCDIKSILHISCWMV